MHPLTLTGLSLHKHTAVICVKTLPEHPTRCGHRSQSGCGVRRGVLCWSSVYLPLALHSQHPSHKPLPTRCLTPPTHQAQGLPFTQRPSQFLVYSVVSKHLRHSLASTSYCIRVPGAWLVLRAVREQASWGRGWHCGPPGSLFISLWHKGPGNLANITVDLGLETLVQKKKKNQPKKQKKELILTY